MIVGIGPGVCAHAIISIIGHLNHFYAYPLVTTAERADDEDSAENKEEKAIRCICMRSTLPRRPRRPSHRNTGPGIHGPAKADLHRMEMIQMNHGKQKLIEQPPALGPHGVHGK